MATSCKKCSYPPAPWKVLLAEELQEKSYIFKHNSFLQHNLKRSKMSPNLQGPSSWPAEKGGTSVPQ